MVEIFFGIITRPCLKQGTFTSVQDLEETSDRYIANYYETASPFRWTKPASHLLGKMKRKQTINP